MFVTGCLVLLLLGAVGAVFDTCRTIRGLRAGIAEAAERCTELAQQRDKWRAFAKRLEAERDDLFEKLGVS